MDAPHSFLIVELAKYLVGSRKSFFRRGVQHDYRDPGFVYLHLFRPHMTGLSSLSLSLDLVISPLHVT